MMPENTTVRLQKEKEIEGHLKNVTAEFERIGKLLADIRDLRLYKPDYHSFAEYIKSRWSISRQHVYDLMRAALISDEHPEIGLDFAAAKELAKTAAATREAVVAVLQVLPPPHRTGATIRTIRDLMQTASQSGTFDGEHRIAALSAAVAAELAEKRERMLLRLGSSELISDWRGRWADRFDALPGSLFAEESQIEIKTSRRGEAIIMVFRVVE
jgi:hypothetical protein